MTAAVEIRGVRRSFADVAVLKGVDLSIRRGEFVALLGRSGSGKSTLLRILARLDQPDSGLVDGTENTAVVFQEARLLPWERVASNVAMGLTRAEARARVRNALDEVGLSHRWNAWPATLSGGEAQRASLARALVREPHLLLLDEPFGALDALTRITMHELIIELCDRHRPAVFMVTHDIDEAIKLSDRVLVIDQGRIDRELRIKRLADGSVAPDFGDKARADLLDALGVNRTARSRPVLLSAS
ncbi:ABC transporter ATP-binding protein [Bradyrhizobium sp. dw_78]|uniref:ABC transporter ATP-binding protein n=1 Tax=Bradyrhizobium sp. dw_78 TaxID=2719793 RepID=UPI001BD6BC41|nr:ABC transporter ATP-binding protein [Bradyrhizobium sp. dw_78]